MQGKFRLFELKNTKLKIKHNFFLEFTKVLEVANIKFPANFRFLTLLFSVSQYIEVQYVVSWIVKVKHPSLDIYEEIYHL